MCEHTDNVHAVNTFPPPTSHYTDDDMTILWWEPPLPFCLSYAMFTDDTPDEYAISTDDLAQTKVTEPFFSALLILLKEHGYA